MAHMIETMAYAGETPWHKLGTAVTDDLNGVQMATAAGLNWSLEKLPVYNLWNGLTSIVPNRYNLTRMTDGFVMDTCSSLYKQVQPSQALDFFKRFVEAGDMKLQTAGSLDHGRRIWALASIEKSFALKGNDEVGGYLLLCSPNRCGESMTIKFCAERVVCHNTLTMALAEGGKTVRVNHLNAFDEIRQSQVVEALGIATSQFGSFFAQAELLSNSVASAENLMEFVGKVSGSKFKDGSNDPDLNRAGKIMLTSILDSPGSDLESARGTWWGALNGVTYAIDHVLGSEETRLNSAWYGDRAVTKEKALSLAVEYANA